MAIYYSYILSLLFLLLMIHWTDTFSLHSLLYSSENKFLDHQNSESIRDQLPLIKRLRRWNKNGDNDEVEIPLNETVLSVNNSDDITSLNSIMNSTLSNVEIIESNSSFIENVDNLINSTSMTTFEIYSDENITTNYPLLRQDFTELNQTIVSIIEDILQDNKTNMNESILSSTVFNEPIDINSMVTNDKNESQTDQIDIFSQTTNQIEPTTAIILLNYTHTTENNQTNSWDLLFNDKTETLLFNDSLMVTTNDELIINSNISQKDAIIPSQEIYINDTEIILIETNDTSILSSKSVSIPICDSSCQCLNECPYGFEILNDTCLCDPPCKNYQCFGNDTCIVTDKGVPLCQPENGTEHDRTIRCYQPRDAGYHDNHIRYYNRWYYNPDQDTCHLFVYRGLGGNENNFRTLNECHLECITCAPLPDSGECLGRINMWYYDKKKNECKQFEYSGCKGNENKFFKKEQCLDTCINRIFNL